MQLYTLRCFSLVLHSPSEDTVERLSGWYLSRFWYI